MLELMRVQAHVALAKRALQEVTPPPTVNARLQALTRRRRQLVNEKVRIVNRMQANLQAVCPGLIEITAEVDNRWFLNLLLARKQLVQLATMRRSSVLNIPTIGHKYAALVAQWQKRAQFAAEAEWIGPMIYEDARRILVLLNDIAALEQQIAALAQTSDLYQRIYSVPGFGLVCSAELAGELGTHQRFDGEASMALYLGSTSLDNSSGKSAGSKTARQVNSRAKAALMTAADRHRKRVPQSQRYYDKKRAEGKTHNQAVRSLARHLVRVLWSMIVHGHDYQLREPDHAVKAA
jgi:transposase